MTIDRVCVIVLNWNSTSDAIDCMESLFGQNVYTPDIVLVDNASHDDSVEQFKSFISRQNSPTIHLVENATNLGFAGGINSGLKVAIKKNYDFVALLNPDAVADNNWLASLVNELKAHPDSGIAGGLMLHRDGKTIDGAGDQYTIWGLPAPRARNQVASEAPDKPEYFFGATGGGMMIRTKILDEIGLFDEKFFMYYEDVDLCFRAQLAGHKVRYTPNAVAYHAQGTSSKKVPGLAVYSTFKNIPMLFWKNVPTKLLPKILPRFAFTYTAILISSIMKGNAWPAVKGWLMSIWLLPHSIGQRTRIQSTAKVSSEYIDSIILQDIPADQTGLRKIRNLVARKS